jgi:hypothetical protein
VSPKNKGKFGKGKSAVEVEDQFVSGAGKVAAALRPHIWRIAVAVGVITLMVVAYSLYGWWNEKKEVAATDLYSEALVIAQREIVPEDIKALEAADEPAPAVAPVTYTTSAERAQAALAVLERLQSEYGGTDVAREARLLHAAMLFELGRYDDALTQYDAYADDGSNAELKAVAREGIAYVYEAKAMALEDAAARDQALEQALEAFRAVQPNDEGPMRELSLYHQGRILQQLGRTDEAAEAFRSALEIDSEGLLENDIQSRLAQLDAPPAE